MRISVLGALEIDGVRFTAPKPAALLATLIAGGGEPVSKDRLVDALWPRSIPRSAQDNLRVYVAQLRRTLGAEGLLVAKPGGYALALPAGVLDADVFGERERSARTLFRDDPPAAARIARQALDLWRGPVFDGLEVLDAARDFARRLEDRRDALCEDWIDLELSLGRHRAVVGELRALVAAHPLRERLYGRLMLALYRSGRRAEALEVYRTARRVLVNELGLEPGAELRQLESDILREELSPPARVSASSASNASSGPPRRRRRDAGGLLRAAALILLLATQSAQPLPPPRTSPIGQVAAERVHGVTGDGILTVATLLPMTGSLYFIGAPMAAGANLAVQDVNAAGGVLGKPVRLVEADSGDPTDDLAAHAVREMVREHVDVVVGAASNTVTEAVLDEVTAADMAMISPSATSGALSATYDKGLLFRTSPSDTVQGTLVGRLVAEDGNRTAVLVALDDSYGDEIVDAARAVLARSGVRIVRTLRYNEGEADFSRFGALDADALVMVGFDETLDLMRRLRRGSGHWYVVDGNLADYSGDLLRGALTGTRGTLAGADPSPEFKARLRSRDPALKDFSYAAESYDAVVLAALAARAAGGDLGPSVAGRLAPVSGGGRRCTSFRQCAGLLEAGVDIDYDGLSGRIEFDSNGDVGEGTFGVYTYGEDNTYARTATRVVRRS